VKAMPGVPNDPLVFQLKKAGRHAGVEMMDIPPPQLDFCTSFPVCTRRESCKSCVQVRQVYLQLLGERRKLLFFLLTFLG